MFSSKFTFPNTGFSLSNTTPTTTSAISTGGGLFGSSIFAAPTSSTATTSSFSNLAFSNLSSSSTFGTTSSPFKSSSTTSPFTIGQQISGTTIKFDPVVSIDNVKKGAVNQKQNIKFMSISAMTQYQTKSFEELRLEDYAANRKTSNLASSFFKPALGTTNAFGTATTSSSASSWFNKSFGGISSSPAITSTSAFGLVSKPLFTPGTFGGLATNPTTTTSSGFIFGTGTTTTAPSGIFGKPIASTSTSIFGTPTTNTTTSKFGNMFGTSLTPASTSAPSLFPSFGSGLATSNSLATTTASGGLFGTKPFGSTPTFGTSGSLFGSSTATSQPANATMPVATTQSSFLFGGTNKPLTSLFGSQTSTSGTSSFFGGQSIQQASQVPIASSGTTGSIFSSQSSAAGVSAQPLSSLLYFASKDKDPEVAKRSAQMLLRAQCYSYSNDPIFNDYVPNSTTDKSSLIGQLSMTVGKAEASTPEPLAHRVRFLLPKPINSSSLYPVSGASRETGKTSFSEQRHNRSIELKRLILPQRSAKNSQLSSTKSKEEINASDLTLEDFLSNSSPSQHSFGLYPRIETVETTPSAKEDTKPLFDCCVKLTRPGYKTCPPIYKLILDPETNSCIISDFAIYREGYGSITWPGITDVANFDLDSIVFIRRKEVIVYPDDDNKPPENEGLNKPAEITLHSVFPLDKFTGQAIKDAHQLDEMNYTQFLEDATTRMGAHFVDYLSATGSWTFKVDHFTRYGLNPQDSHVDPEYKFATNSMYCWQNKNEKDLKCPGNFSPDAYSTVLHCLNGDQKENVDTMPIKELTRRISSMTSDLSKQEDDDVLEYISNQSELLNKSQTTLNEYQFVPIQIPWSSSLLNTDRNLTWDRAFFVSKSFRFNLHGSKRIYYCPSDNTDESLSVLRPSKFSTDCSRSITNVALTTQFLFHQFVADESSLFPRIAIMQTNEFIGKMKTNISALKEDIITFNILNDSLSLLNILFVDDVDEISRKSNLICWLKSSINPSIVHEKCIYSQILHHLCNLDRKYAVQKAMSSNNFRLAQLISVPPGMANVQNALKNQLIHWCDREADQFIEKILLKIYLLLSGELFIELSDSTSVSLIVDKSWRENLLIILGYCCLADATCANAIVLLDNLVKSNLCVAEEDLSWNILKFYVDPATSDICDILQISKFIQTDDYSLSWYMLQAVDSLAIKRISSSIYDKVCIEFARQLEGVGMWDWACFVLSHINDPKIRSFMCEDILNRNVCADHDLCSIETWLTHELHWNPAIIHKAKSIKAQYQKNWFLCCDHKIQANDPHAALVMIFEKILPESFEKDDRAELVQLLELIAIYVQLNGPVEGWMNSGYSLHLYFSTQSKFANNDTLNSDTGLLEFAETVTRNFDIITSKLNDFVKEGKIGLSILSSICEGICSSMYLLCKWISQGSLLKYHYDRALEIIIAKETIISRVNSVEFCEEVNITCKDGDAHFIALPFLYTHDNHSIYPAERYISGLYDLAYPFIKLIWLWFIVLFCMSVVLQRCFQKRSKIYQSIASHYFLRPTVMVSRCSATKSNDTINLKNTNKPTIIKVIPRKRINYDVDYTANNYVTPIRALYEYILNPEDLEGLKVYTRRSPYQQESNPIKVFLRADVEAKALEIWGSLQNLQDKFARRKRSGYFSENQDFVKLKKALRDYQKKQAFIDSIPHHQSVPVQKRFSRVVIIAATINGINVIIKAIAFAMTGSASIFSEMIHSIADMINQIILAYGQYKSLDKPDPDHPYGFNNMTYITSLISGVGIFCFGTGLTWYHGVTSLLSSVSPTYLSTGICLLSLSMLSESGTLYFALRENTRNAKQMNMTLFEYIKLGYNPAINVVLLEDAAAVCGVGVAGVSMLASHFLESPIPDAIGSIIIGGMLGYIAYFIISTNSFALTHRSIHPSQLYAIQRDLENDICVRALFDVKATDMGNQCAMFKAEIDLDGAAIARTYLDKTDVDALLQELKLCQTPEELERFLVHHGEMVIDRVGEEIDRIERKIKKKYPTLRHVDLEVL